MRRQRLTPALIESTRLVTDAKRSSHGRIEIRDTSSRLMLRVTANAARSYITRPHFGGQAIRLTYPGPATVENYSMAKTWADDAASHAAKGIDPRTVVQRKDGPRQFGAIVETFMERHASKNKTANETQRIFDRYVLPEWRNRQITEITRRDVADLLDKIEDGTIKGPNGAKFGGPVMADRTLAAIRKLMNWYAARDDDFVSPVVRGMARTKAKDRARDRVLSDDELCTLWPLLDGMNTFGALVKVLMLTAQRRDEVANMRRSEINGEGIWTIPAERYKTNRANVIPLSEAAHAVIAAQPIIDGSDFVLTVKGKNPFNGFSKAKRRLDDATPEVASWRLHDLRRTAKTLMMRAGVRPDISERVLGHVIPGVEGVYDRHSYLDEKKDAMGKLATMIHQIVSPPASDKVVTLRTGADS